MVELSHQDMVDAICKDARTTHGPTINALIRISARMAGLKAEAKVLSQTIPDRDSCQTCKGAGGPPVRREIRDGVTFSYFDPCPACAAMSRQEWLKAFGIWGLLQ